jgi:hypothetical protein
LERISTQTLMDILEVPQRQRTAGAYRHRATFNRLLLRGNDVMCIAINPQRHITGSELSSAFGA